MRSYSTLSFAAKALLASSAFAQQSGYLGLTGNTVYIKSDAATSAKTTGIGSAESFSSGKGNVFANVNDVSYLFTNTPLAGKLNIDMAGGSNYTAQPWNTSTGAATGWASHDVKATYGTQAGNHYTGPGQTLNGGGFIDGGMFDKSKDSVSMVEGHTDNRGSDRYNLDLSVLRANAVFAELKNMGFKVDAVKGYGFHKPADTNAAAEGRTRNHCVTLQVSVEKATMQVDVK